MADNSDSEMDNKPKEPPAPEVLRPQSIDGSTVSNESLKHAKPKANLRLRHGTYRPSHKATFIGLAVVVVILAVNAAVIVYIMRGQNQSSSDKKQSEVTISSDVLNTLGVTRSTIGDSGTELVVNPNATFNSKVTISGDVSIAGQLKLNSKLLATDVNMTKLEAGDTTLQKLNVNGDTTLSNLALRKDLNVVGTTRLQGAVVITQLLTVDNSVNISGNLSVGGILSIGAFQTNTLTIGGHITTRGSAPSISSGPAVGNNGTVSISGNDASGTVAVNAGTGAGNGVLANVTFVNEYSNTPHVIISIVGRGTGSAYISRSSSGFSIGINGALSPGGYAFDYIVMQ